MKQRHLTQRNLFSQKTKIFAVQIANVTIHTHLKSHFAEILVLLLEYAQLMSQGILLYPGLYSDKYNVYENYPLIRGITYAAKLINPSYLLSFKEEKGFTETVLGIVLGFFVIKQCMSIYVLCEIFLDKKVHPIPMQLLRWIYQTHSRVGYYFLTSFFVRSILARKEFGFTFLGIGETGDLIVCIFVIVVELILGLLPRARLFYALPTKSLLAAKDNTVEIITIVQKITIQLLQVLLSGTSIATRWILFSINLMFTVLRTYKYFAELPLYHIKGLFIQGSLVGITASLHISGFVNLILVSRGTVNENLKFILVSWIILGLLSIQLSGSLVKKLIFRILTKKNSSCQLLVHRIEIIKQFLKRQKLPHKSASNNDWYYLLVVSISKNLESVFGLAADIDFVEKSKMTKLFAIYLEKLFAQHPKNEFLKLYLAFYYAKKMKNFPRATVLILELQKDLGARLFLNASFLLSEIQASLKSNYTTRKNLFDLYTYAQSQMEIDKLKLVMNKQVDLQSQVCEELLKNNSDLNKVFFSAQSASRYKQKVLRRIKKIRSIIPQYHVSPLMLCAYYNLIVNQSPADYQKLWEIYHLRNQKSQKYLSKDILAEENIYQDNCALLVVSALKSETAKIIYCGPSVRNVCGGEPEWYIGSKIYDRICSPSLRPVTENFYRSLAEPEGSALLNQIIRTFVFHKEGYLFEADAYLNPYPSVAHGYLIALLLRSKPDNRDFIIVRENGEIEGASRQICKRLGIFQPETHRGKKYNINQICGELGRVNNAMNIVSSVDKDNVKYDVSITVKRQEEDNNAGHKFDTLFVDEARYLYTLYTEKGNDITLQPEVKKTQNSYDYFCKASNLVVDAFVLRIFNLQEIANGSQSEIRDIVEEITFIKEEESLEATDAHEDEKEQGWIDFGMLGTEPDPKSLVECGQKDASGTLGKKLQVKLTKGDSPKLTKNRETEREHDQPQTTETNGLLPVPVPVPVKVAVSGANSTSSRKSYAMGMFEAMKLALETRHYSKFFKVILFFSILLLILTIMVVVGLFTSLDQTIQSLKFKKDIMNYAQTRGYYVVNLQTSVRGIYDVVEGNIALPDMKRAGIPLQKLMFLGKSYIEAMALSNKNLMNSINSLSEASKKEFYVKNVTIVYPSSTQVMNNFQATETLIQGGLKIIDLAQANQNIPQDLFDGLNVNLMNDVLVKNDLIAQLTVLSVQDEVNSMHSLNNRYYLAISIAASGLACFLCFIIWYQYKGERNNLTQLTRLNHSGIASILERYRIFKLHLVENDQIPTNLSGEAFLAIVAKKGVRQTNKSYSHSPKFTNLQKRFLLYGVKGTALSLGLLAALVFSMVFTSNSIDYLNKKLSQLTFMNRLGNRVSFLTTATIELPISNGAAEIWNLPIIPATEYMMTLLAGDREGLMTTFLSEDLLDNQEINQLLFGDTCELLDQSYQLYCTILSDNTVNSSMARLSGSFETLLIERMRDYQSSDESAAALKANRLYQFELLIAMKRILTQASILVSNLLNEAYENKLESLNGRKITGLCSGLGSLLVIFAVLWVLVMKPIRESDNNFKKVLQIFSAEMILSNFSLKMFLLKTSSVDINLKKYFDKSE